MHRVEKKKKKAMDEMKIFVLQITEQLETQHLLQPTPPLD